MVQARGRSEPDGKEHYWRDLLLRWQRSGQTIRAFCAEHRLSEASFYAWRKALAPRTPPNPGPSRTTGTSAAVDPRSGDRPAFVPVHVTPAPRAAGLELVVGPNRVVRVAPDFDADTLRRLLALLEEAPPC